MDRMWHTWDEWECYPAGLYEVRAPNHTADEADEEMRRMLSNPTRFQRNLKRVLDEWPLSCEHYLSNERMDRLWWLRSAALCIETAIPKRFRGGYKLLNDEEREIADILSLDALNRWLNDHGESSLTMDDAKSKTQMDLY